MSDDENPIHESERDIPGGRWEWFECIASVECVAQFSVLVPGPLTARTIAERDINGAFSPGRRGSHVDLSLVSHRFLSIQQEYGRKEDQTILADFSLLKAYPEQMKRVQKIIAQTKAIRDRKALEGSDDDDE